MLERKVYNNDDITFFAKPECDNVLLPEPRSGEGCNTLSHSGLAIVIIRKKCFILLLVYYFIYRMASSFENDTPCDGTNEPCCNICFENDRLNVKATSFCDDCVQFMCDKCIKIHERLNSTRLHVVKTGRNMPRSQADKPPKFNFCVEHPKYLKNQFCSVHKQLICSLCSPLYHKNCSTGSVEDVSKSISSPETVSSIQLPHTGPAENFPATAGKRESARQSVALTQLKGRKLGSYNVKLSDDSNDCWIRGMAITNDGRRLLVDYTNKKVKLFSQDMKLLSSLSLSDPRDIAVISNKEAVVTTVNTSLVLLNISARHLSINTTTRVPFDVRGISKYGEKLVVTSSIPEPPSVKLIDKTGRVHWSVSTDDQGQSLFSQPRFVTSDIERNTVTVTDCENKTLTVLNGDTGDVIKRRSLKDKSPRGVTTGPSGNIYVCYCGTREVAELTGDLAEERILLSQQDGLGDRPYAIVYDKSCGQLITSYVNYSSDDNSVDVFNSHS